MNIYDYIDEYGIYSFNERKINEVDCCLFSFLSYADYSDIFDEKDSVSIDEAARKHVGLHLKKEINVIAVKEGNKLLRYIKDTKRYRNCILKNYQYVADNTIQFGALSIEYLPNKVFVSFEGTDQEFSGWKENFMLSYQFPTKSHNMAISYLNKYYKYSLKELIIGGHSKGGNLALVSSMYCSFLVRLKLKKIYNVDGPGLLDEQFNSIRYENIKDKYYHIIPDYSLVGLLLNHSNDIVVESANKGILAHNIIYWQIKNNQFVRSRLSPMSNELDTEIKKWFIKYSDAGEDYFPVFSKNLDDILTKSQVTSILDLKTKKMAIFNLIYESREMDDSTKKLLIDLILLLIKCFGDTKKSEIKHFITNMFKIKNNQENEEGE